MVTNNGITKWVLQSNSENEIWFNLEKVYLKEQDRCTGTHQCSKLLCIWSFWVCSSYHSFTQHYQTGELIMGCSSVYECF